MYGSEKVNEQGEYEKTNTLFLCLTCREYSDQQIYRISFFVFDTQLNSWMKKTLPWMIHSWGMTANYIMYLSTLKTRPT